MNTKQLPINAPLARIGLALLFVALGSLIIIVFSQYRPLLSAPADLLGRLLLLSALLAAALVARRSPSLQPVWRLLFGLFILLAAVSLDWWVARFILQPLDALPATPAGIALEKLKTAAIVAATVLTLTRLSGGPLSVLYIQRGHLKQGLTTGLIAFGVAAATAVPLSQLFFAGAPVTLAQVLQWAPWILIAVFSNAVNEELLFRGLFLRKLEPFYGKALSNVLVVLVFTGLHLGVTYARDQLLFLAVVVPLALAWGAIMQKTEGIWGSILFHAGMDIPVFLSIFSTRF